jgi:hypothetical protein
MQFLHYDMFWTLFLAIIKWYLYISYLPVMIVDTTIKLYIYSPSQLFCFPPFPWPMFTMRGRLYCCLQCRSLVLHEQHHEHIKIQTRPPHKNSENVHMCDVSIRVPQGNLVLLYSSRKRSLYRTQEYTCK